MGCGCAGDCGVATAGLGNGRRSMGGILGLVMSSGRGIFTGSVDGLGGGGRRFIGVVCMGVGAGVTVGFGCGIAAGIRL